MAMNASSMNDPPLPCYPELELELPRIRRLFVLSVATRCQGHALDLPFVGSNAHGLERLQARPVNGCRRQVGFEVRTVTQAHEPASTLVRRGIHRHDAAQLGHDLAEVIRNA
jgi:hypothetical protein